MRTVICDFEKLTSRDFHARWEQNHYVIRYDYNSCYDVTLCAFLDSKENIEIGLYIDYKKGLSPAMYEYCKKHRIILYFDLFDLDSVIKDPCWGIDKVTLLSSEVISGISHEMVKRIIEYDINVCVIDVKGDYLNINSLHASLVSQGFDKMFYSVRIDDEDESSFNSSLINRAMLTEHNTSYNFLVKTQYEKIQQNALHKFNRLRVNKSQTDLKIILINLSVSYMNEQKVNLGIEYLSSVLFNDGFETQCLYTHRETCINDINAIMKNNPNIRMIGFSCMEDNIHAVAHVISYCKGKYPNLVCWIGGAQASAIDAKFIGSNKIDYVMIGESELSISQLANYVINSKGDVTNIGNLKYIDSHGNCVETRKVDLIKNLDILPFPRYVYQIDDAIKTAAIITGRGCPFNCAFCFEGAKEKSVRFRSLENVFEEISLLVKNHKNLKHIQFYDDTFTIDENRVLLFCEKFKSIYDLYGITWGCEIHCQTVYKKLDLLKTMVQAGWVSAQIGIENGNQEILDKFNKKITSQMICETIINCRLAGLDHLEGNIIVGGAGETNKQLDEQFAFIRKIMKVGAGFFELHIAIFWPYPNVPIALNPEKYGVSILQNQYLYSKSSMRNIVTESSDVGRDQLVKYYYKLINFIKDLYDTEVLKLTAKEAQNVWRYQNSRWKQAMNNYEHIRCYFISKSKIDIDINSGNIYPIRTFELLEYKDNRIYLTQSKKLFDELDSRILELCNGKITIDAISKLLNCNNSEIIDRLKILEDGMFVYGSVV